MTTERNASSTLKKQEKRKSEFEESSIRRNQDLRADDDQTMSSSQENQSDSSGEILPPKKRMLVERISPPSKKNVPQKRPNRIERDVAEPSSRALLPCAPNCLSKTLSSSDVIPEDTKLNLNFHEAIILTDCPRIEDDPKGTFSMILLVYDKDDKPYNMVLSHFIRKGDSCYSLSAGWKTFVRAHGLKRGDEITIYKKKFHYIIKFTKNGKSGGSDLAEAITDFGEKFMRLEMKKIEMIGEMEKNWMEAEKKRMKSTLRMHEQMIMSISSAFGDDDKKGPDGR